VLWSRDSRTSEILPTPFQPHRRPQYEIPRSHERSTTLARARRLDRHFYWHQHRRADDRSTYSNSFSLPGTNSTHALKLLEQGFKSKSGDADQIVFAVKQGTLASHEATINAMLAKIEKMPKVGSVTSPFCPTGSTTYCPGALQMDKADTIGYATVDFTKQANLLAKSQIRAVQTLARRLDPSPSRSSSAATPSVLSTRHRSPGEGLGLLATAIVLFLAFGSLFAMLLPLG